MKNPKYPQCEGYYYDSQGGLPKDYYISVEDYKRLYEAPKYYVKSQPEPGKSARRSRAGIHCFVQIFIIYSGIACLLYLILQMLENAKLTILVSGTIILFASLYFALIILPNWAADIQSRRNLRNASPKRKSKPRSDHS